MPAFKIQGDGVNIREVPDVYRLQNYRGYIDGWVVFARVEGTEEYQFAGTATSRFMEQPGRGSHFEIAKKTLRISEYQDYSDADNPVSKTTLDRWGLVEYIEEDGYREPFAFYLPIGDRYILGRPQV